MFGNLKKLNNGRTRVKVIVALLVMILTLSNFTFLGSYIGKTSYAVDTDISKQDENEGSNQVKIKVLPKAMTETLYQGQVVTYEITAKNNGKEDLEDIKLVYTVPEGAVITELTYAQGTEIIYTDKENIAHRTITLEGKLKAGQERTAEITLRIKDDATQIIHNIVAQNTQDKVIGSLTTNPVEVISGDLNVMLSRRDNWASILSEGTSIRSIAIIKNNTNAEMKNLKITSILPEGLSWVKDSEYNKDWTYNEQTKEISYAINVLGEGETKHIWFESKVDKTNKMGYENKIENKILLTTESGEEYASNVYANTINKAGYKITMTASHNETLKEGDAAKYIINITNIGKGSRYITLTDEMPKEIEIEEINCYDSKGKKSNKIETISSDNIVSISPNNAIAEEDSIVIEIVGKVKNLESGITSKKITNIAKIPVGYNEYVESNAITNTIIKNPNNSGDNNPGENNPGGNNPGDNNQGGSNPGENNPGGNNPGDNNQGGSNPGENNPGGNNPGDNNPGDNNPGGDNSGGNNQGEENPVFDLSLNKYITKVVVTTSKNVSTYDYEKPTNLAKVEINKREISGANLLVEYEIEVVNNGNVEGYVTDIIDYLPKELTFSSEMNTEWYKDAEGYLHYMALEPKAIKPGESQKIKLVLTRNLKNNVAGTIENIAEIGASTNLEGIAELDSTAGNHKDGEDDMSKAELIVSIETGSVALYIGIVIASMFILIIGIYIINKKVLKVRI